MDAFRIALSRVVLSVLFKKLKTHTCTKHFLNHNSDGPPAKSKESAGYARYLTCTNLPLAL